MLNEPVNVHQGDNKTMAVHHERFKNVVHIAEGQWGESHPTKIAENNGKCSGEKTKASRSAAEKFQCVCFCTVLTESVVVNALRN